MLNSMSSAIVGTENMTVTDTASFISFGDMYNARELAKNDLQHGVISTAIASAIHAGTKELNPIPTMARNLLHEYNTLTKESLTVAECLMSKEFLRYCAKEILLDTIEKNESQKEPTVTEKKGG